MKIFRNIFIPEKYIDVIERIMNSKRIDDFRPNIGSFINASGGGRISSTAGEILTMASLGMTDEQFSFLDT